MYMYVYYIVVTMFFSLKAECNENVMQVCVCVYVWKDTLAQYYILIQTHMHNTVHIPITRKYNHKFAYVHPAIIVISGHNTHKKDENKGINTHAIYYVVSRRLLLLLFLLMSHNNGFSYMPRHGLPQIALNSLHVHIFHFCSPNNNIFLENHVFLLARLLIRLLFFCHLSKKKGCFLYFLLLPF